MHSSILEKRTEIAELCVRFDVRRLEVFGSAARGADFDIKHSDADFLVEFEQGSRIGPLEAFFDLQAGLALALGRPVDLVESCAVKNPYLRQSINSAREVIYAA